MESRLLATIIIFPIWLTLILVFRKNRQWLFYYLTAAFGLTLMLVFMMEYLGWDEWLVSTASFHVYLVTKFILHLPINLLSAGRFQLILTSGDTSILKLGIECSAVLESSILISLIGFYPLFNFRQKLLRITFGLVITYVINIIRIMIIVLMAYKFGSDYIFLAHAGAARIFFFIFELLLYWYLLTKPTVKAVGEGILRRTRPSEQAMVGRSLTLRHAVAQGLVVFVFGALVLSSFGFSNDWPRAYEGLAKKARPLIYKEETSLEVRPKNGVLGVEEEILKTWDFELDSGAMENRRLKIEDLGHANLRLTEGAESIQIEVYLNEEFQNRTVMEQTGGLPIIDKLVFSRPFDIAPGDTLELRLKNLGRQPAKYRLVVTEGGVSE